MRHRTKLVVGAAPLRSRCSLGALLGGVLAESPSAGRRPSVAARRISESALSEIAGGGTQADGRAARGGARRRRHDDPAARVARARLPGSLARDRRCVLPAALGRRARVGARGAAATTRRHARARESGADPARVRPRARRRPRGAAGSRRTRRGPTASSATPRSSSAATPPRSRASSGWSPLKPNLASYCAHRLRPRAERRHAGRDRGDAARPRRGRRPARADRLGRGRARQARVRPRPGRRRGRAFRRGARDLPRLRLRARAARACRGRPRPARRGGRAGAPAPRGDPAAAVRRPARRSPRAPGPPAEAAASARPSPRSTACSPPAESASTSSRPSTAPTTAIRPGGDRRARAHGARARPSIYGDDALGWALARAGRCDEAVRWSQRSLRLGTRDALLWFHRGYAAGCAGDAPGMKRWYRKALALNPHFSVRFAPLARKAVA